MDDICKMFDAKMDKRYEEERICFEERTRSFKEKAKLTRDKASK